MEKKNPQEILREAEQAQLRQELENKKNLQAKQEDSVKIWHALRKFSEEKEEALSVQKKLQETIKIMRDKNMKIVPEMITADKELKEAIREIDNSMNTLKSKRFNYKKDTELAGFEQHEATVYNNEMNYHKKREEDEIRQKEASEKRLKEVQMIYEDQAWSELVNLAKEKKEKNAEFYEIFEQSRSLEKDIFNLGTKWKDFIKKIEGLLADGNYAKLEKFLGEKNLKLAFFEQDYNYRSNGKNWNTYLLKAHKEDLEKLERVAPSQSFWQGKAKNTAAKFAEILKECMSVHEELVSFTSLKNKRDWSLDVLRADIGKINEKIKEKKDAFQKKFSYDRYCQRLEKDKIVD